MSAKTVLAVIVALGASWAWGFIPPAAYVLEQIAQKNPVKHIRPTQFNAMVSSDQTKQFAKLSLSNQGLSDGQQLIDLRVLDALVRAKDAIALRAYLTKIGINTSVVGLGFFGNEPVYIIGALAGDTTSAQLWVDKYSFFPLRELWSEREMTFDKWQALSSPGAHFPRLITSKTKHETKNYALAEIEAN